MIPEDRALTVLHHQLCKISPIPEEEWCFLSAQVRCVRFEKGEQLVSYGAEPQVLWLLLRGIVRFFYVSEKGRECNKAFARDGDLIAPLVAIATGQPCHFSIEALESVDALAIPVSILPELYDRHRCWDRIGRVLTEQALVRKEVREREFLLDDPMVRYRCFLERYPGIERQIAQKQIAAYIGISEVSLSRLLRRVRQPALDGISGGTHLNKC